MNSGITEKKPPLRVKEIKELNSNFLKHSRRRMKAINNNTLEKSLVKHFSAGNVNLQLSAYNNAADEQRIFDNLRSLDVIE